MNDVTYTGPEFYISYIDKRSEFAAACDVFVALACGNEVPQEQEETALCIRDEAKVFGKKFYILYGDHRKAYSALIPDLAACVAYFRANLDKIGHSSDRPTEETVQ